MGATMGANVRVGLEEWIYVGRGPLPAKSNAEQVTCIRAILEALSLEGRHPPTKPARCSPSKAAAESYVRADHPKEASATVG